jgi:hypothetical protein
MTTRPAMPEALREELIEILASVLVADVEKHPGLYGLESPADQGLVAAAGETARDSTRGQQGRRAKRVPGRHELEHVCVSGPAKSLCGEKTQAIAELGWAASSGGA